MSAARAPRGEPCARVNVCLQESDLSRWDISVRRFTLAVCYVLKTL